MAWLRCGNKLIDYRRSLFWTMVEGRRKNLHRSFTNSTLHSLFFVVFLVCVCVCVGECWRSLQMFSRDPEWGGIRWLLRPCHAVVLASGMPSGDMSRKPGRLWMLAWRCWGLPSLVSYSAISCTCYRPLLSCNIIIEDYKGIFESFDSAMGTQRTASQLCRQRLLLVNLSIFSMKISAFVLVCGRVLVEARACHVTLQCRSVCEVVVEEWFKMIEDDWMWLKMIEAYWRWLKLIEDDWRWLTMTEDDWWRWLKTIEVTRWLMIDEDDWRIWLKMMDGDGWRWLKMTEDDRSWLNMIEEDAWWFMIDEDGWRWLMEMMEDDWGRLLMKMTEDNWRWLKMIDEYDWRILQMMDDDWWRWLKMAENDWRWTMIDEDSWRWLRTIEDDWWIWLQVIEDDGRWWMKMTEDDWSWLTMIEDDWRWLMMIDDWWRWLKMTEDDWWLMKTIEHDWWIWLKMIEDDGRWLMKMTEDDWRWLKMIEDDCLKLMARLWFFERTSLPCEVCLFLMAFLFLIVAFATAITAFHHSLYEFSSVDKGMETLLEITLGSMAWDLEAFRYQDIPFFEVMCLQSSSWPSLLVRFLPVLIQISFKILHLAVGLWLGSASNTLRHVPNRELQDHDEGISLGGDARMQRIRKNKLERNAVPLPNIRKPGFKWSTHVHISAGLQLAGHLASCARKTCSPKDSCDCLQDSGCCCAAEPLGCAVEHGLQVGPRWYGRVRKADTCGYHRHHSGTSLKKTMAQVPRETWHYLALARRCTKDIKGFIMPFRQVTSVFLRRRTECVCVCATSEQM